MSGTASFTSTVDARARRAQRRAVARAMHGSRLDWAGIDASPAWVALTPAELERLSAHAGAWWLAASLRTCIDGKRLARVCALLGERRLNALRDAPAASPAEALDQAPKPSLPPADDMPQHLLACGRALLGWSLPDDVRAPVLDHLGWSVDPVDGKVFDAHADWARRALAAALANDTPPAEPDATELEPQLDLDHIEQGQHQDIDA